MALQRIARCVLFLTTLVVVASASLVLIMHASTPRVDVLSLRGVVNPTQASYIRRGISEANKAETHLIVIEMDTPGGLDSSMRDIIQAILDSKVPVAVYVVPGGRAASAGTFIAMASHVAAMAPGTAIGAASPVGSQGEDIQGTLGEKVKNDAAEYIRSLAKMRGRNADWAAEEAVRQAKSLDAEGALEHRVIEFMEPTLGDFLTALDGYSVTIGEHRITIETDGAELHTNKMNFVEQFLFAVSDPNIALILLSVAMLAIFFELANPGAIFPGVVGGIGMLLSLYALGTLQANWAGLLLIGLAFILFVLEIFVTSGGVLGAGGVASFILGALMLWGNDAPPGLHIDRLVLYPTAAVLGLFFVFVIQAVVRAHKKRPVTGLTSLAGQTAVARTPLDPYGTVFVQGELWQAKTTGEKVNLGEEVEIVGAEGLTLQVRKEIKGGP
jgi:membrane-bound serine protease (ClpP class)